MKESRDNITGEQPDRTSERVGRVNLDAHDMGPTETRRDRAWAMVIAGILAVLVMVLALLMILPGVFER